LDRMPRWSVYYLQLNLRRAPFQVWWRYPVWFGLLGLGWDDVDLDAAEVTIDWQLQRIGHRLLRGRTKTKASDPTLPLPDTCTLALRQTPRPPVVREARRRGRPAGIP
jgi:hypothetical protein